MAKSLIPMRPDKGNFNLTEDEMQGLTWFVISGCSRQEAFLKFIRPDYIGTRAKVAMQSAISQFFSAKEVMAYIDAYRDTLSRVLSVKTPKSSTGQSTENLRLSAKAKLMEFAMGLATNIENAEDPEFVLKIADKVGILDGNDIEETPRRYLPENCAHCTYRAFCEENAEDMCPYCKYHQYGEENGIHFDKENMLNLNTEEND